MSGPGKWHTSGGEFSILCASSPISFCEPHFHETYTVALAVDGEVSAQFQERGRRWQKGQLIIINPYQIMSGVTVSRSFEYKVCYPSASFMGEALARGRADHGLPRLNADALCAETVAELAGIVVLFTAPDAATRSAAKPEELLFRFIREHSELIEPRAIYAAPPACVIRACELIEQSLGGPIRVGEIAARVGCDRSHLARSFQRATGLSPITYIRQLRLARALDSLLEGSTVSEAAYRCGMADQAHLTREFKRIYGTTPGKLSRDLAAAWG